MSSLSPAPVQVDPAELAAHLEDLARIAQTVAQDLRNGLAVIAESGPAGARGEPAVSAVPNCLLDVKALTGLLLANERTIRRWRQMPGFPKPIRKDGPLRWRRSAIEAWLERKPR